MPPIIERPLPGLTVTIDEGAVRVTSERDLTVLSSAVVAGGLTRSREIINLHVDDAYDGERPEDDLRAYAQRAGIPGGFVGLMTATHTEFARVAVERHGDLAVAAVVSVGLSNTTNAGVSPPLSAAGPGAHGTINVVLLVDGAPTPAAMVNLVITVTEAKTMTLGRWDVRARGGEPASGTSTDSVVVVCTGRGEELRYGGPVADVGWLSARAVRAAMERICREKIERDGGRDGW